MLAVDKFKIILLVGLICALGIAPTNGIKCMKEGVSQDCEPADTHCSEAGCVDGATMCSAEATTEEIKCEADKKCCCQVDDCNTKEKLCAAKSDLDICKAAPTGGEPTQGPEPGGGGGGSGGDATTVTSEDSSGTTFVSSIGTIIFLVSVGASLRLDKVYFHS